MAGKLRPSLLNQVLEELNIMEHQAHPAFGKAKRDCIRELINRELNKDSTETNLYPDDYVYCTECDNFSVDKNDTPCCHYENECYLWDCEDGRRYSERHKYKKKV